MPKHQCKNTINNSQGSITPPELSYSLTARYEYFNASEAQENDLKKNLMKIIGFLKSEIFKIPLKKLEKRQRLEETNKSLRGAKKNQTGEENCQRPKIEIKAIKKTQTGNSENGKSR